MSTVNKIAMHTGRLPRAAIKNGPVKSLVIGATSEVWNAKQDAKATQSVIETLLDMGFSEAEAHAIAVEGA